MFPGPRANYAMRVTVRPASAALTLIGAVFLSVACGGSQQAGGASSPASGARPSDAPTATAVAPVQSVAATPSFPTGPAVTVSGGYEPPRDRVASTGAYLPSNGKPTLVYVDAIW